MGYLWTMFLSIYENKLDKKENFKILSLAFQRRYRQELINGIIDQECLSISKNLLKKLK